MRPNLGLVLRIWVVLCLVVCVSAVGSAQDAGDGDLTAKTRLLPGIGPGLRAVRRGADGRVYVLASPAPGLVVFDGKGQQVFTVAASPVVEKGARPTIVFGEDFDVDGEGRIYVADRGADAVEVLSRDGAPVRSIPVHAPTSVAAIGEGEVAVATLREPHLVIVFDKNGRDVREFGDPEQISEREDLNRFLNIGQLVTDAQNHLYYAFLYMPEPTVRQYDRNGYDSGQDVQYTAVEAASEAQAVRREIVKQEKHQKAPVFKRVLTGVGVNAATGEVWMSVGNTLMRFDKDGSRRASYKLYTPDGARLEANTILVEPESLIIGNDPLGIYRFDRPDKATH
jgi:hypothetical protein